MSIQKLEKNNYFIRVTKTINGKKIERKLKSSFATVGQARFAESELKEELLKLKAEKESQVSKVLWKDALNDYFLRGKSEYSVTTYASRKSILDAHTGKMKDMSILDMSFDFWTNYFVELKVSEGQKKEVLKFVKQVFDLQVLKANLAFNPIKSLKIWKDGNVTHAKKLIAMTQDEIRILLNYLKTNNHEWYPIFYITYQLGLRAGEAKALKFENISWEKKHVVINQSYCKLAQVYKTPKNGRSRLVPLNEETIQLT